MAGRKPGNHPFIEEKHRRKHRYFESEGSFFSVGYSGGVFGKTPGLFGLLRQSDFRIRLAMGRLGSKVLSFDCLKPPWFNVAFDPGETSLSEQISRSFLPGIQVLPGRTELGSQRS
jgi:hypothetical protein